MNIALIVKRLDVQGGIQREVLYFAIELQKKGHDVTVYTVRHQKGKGFVNLINQVRVVSLPEQFCSSGIRFIRRFFPLFISEQLRDIRNAKSLAMLIDPTTECLNPHHDPVTYKAAYYFKKYIHKIPSVWMMNDFNTKYSSFLRSGELRGRGQLSLLKHAGYWIFDTYERMHFIKVQEAITVLDYHDRDLARQYLKRDAIVVRQGVDVSQFPFIVHKSPEKRPVKILMIGIFFTHRRFEDAVRALHILRESGDECLLTIIGDQATDQIYAHAIKDLVHEYDLNNIVTFRGRVSEKELFDAYADHDIFLFPSHLQSWGLAVFEAMASGLPVIVSRTAGASEVLTHDENALIVDPKKPSEIALSIQRLVNDPVLYKKLSRYGRVFVEKKLSWKQYAQTMLGIFKRVMRSHH